MREDDCPHQDALVEAEEIAAQIGALCVGRESAAVLFALSMVLGRFEAQAKRPNMDNLMRIVGNTARFYFDHARPN